MGQADLWTIKELGSQLMSQQEYGPARLWDNKSVWQADTGTSGLFDNCPKSS